MSLRRVLSRGLGGADAVLALFVVAVVALMVVPLPTFLLDLLLAANLSAAIAILLVVLYVPDAISVATFPTVLLLSTLFRLGLNVASTRLILLQADAGEVIRAFGTFVVRGNYLVGAIVFLILTIIQFVVIAKGAERVAEVGARFALDAMPGKQMAIDAELRAGSIDAAEARRRRRQLSRESQFYGAMDGAMKFVKGDVIASVIITVINVLGGLAIGVLQRDMGALDALKRYGLLTIGDGLVTQIPALVLSTAAGVLVTRVASEDSQTSLGQELGRQLFGAPKALRVAALFIALLALVPGLPLLPFLVLATLLFAAAVVRERGIRAANAVVPRRREGSDAQFHPLVAPWSLEVGPELLPLLRVRDREGEAASPLSELADGVIGAVFRDLGVRLPEPIIRVRPDIGESVLLSLYEVPAASMPVDPAQPEAALSGLSQRVTAILSRRAADYLGLTEVQRMLDAIEAESPALVRSTVPKPLPLSVLTDILRRLVEERVSIRDMRTILESLCVLSAAEKDPLQLSEMIRSQLRRATTFRLTEGRGNLPVMTVDGLIEDVIRRAVTRGSAGAFLTLSPSASRDLLRAFHQAFASLEQSEWSGERPPVVVSPDTRRFVRKLLERDFPDVRVLAVTDLVPELSLSVVGRVVPTA